MDHNKRSKVNEAIILKGIKQRKAYNDAHSLYFDGLIMVEKYELSTLRWVLFYNKLVRQLYCTPLQLAIMSIVDKSADCFLE